MNKIITYISCIIQIPTVIYVYGSWIIIHYAAGHLYTCYCTPLSIYGFLLSPFTATLPYCQALRWIIYNSGDYITNMWILMGGWLLFHMPLIGEKK